MEFFVDITIDLPPDMPEALRAELDLAETARGRELLDLGAIRHLWRVPGARRNLGIWWAVDGTALHELLTSLPLHRWMTIAVVPLAVHPLHATQ